MSLKFGTPKIIFILGRKENLISFVSQYFSKLLTFAAKGARLVILPALIRSISDLIISDI